MIKQVDMLPARYVLGNEIHKRLVRFSSITGILVLIATLLAIGIHRNTAAKATP